MLEGLLNLLAAERQRGQVLFFGICSFVMELVHGLKQLNLLLLVFHQLPLFLLGLGLHLHAVLLTC